MLVLVTIIVTIVPIIVTQDESYASEDRRSKGTRQTTHNTI